MKTISVNKLRFKKNLSMIEQFSIKDFLYKMVGGTTESLDDILPLEYTENVFAKMEVKQTTVILNNGTEHLRYATITEDNQIVIAVLNSNEELIHKIISLDEILRGEHL